MAKGITPADVRRIALSFKGVEAGTSYGTVAYRVRRKLLARLHQDGATLVLRVDMALQFALIDINPDVFYITPHYVGHPYILVRMAAANPQEIHDLFGYAWRDLAPQKLLRACMIPDPSI